MKEYWFAVIPPINNLLCFLSIAFLIAFMALLSFGIEVMEEHDKNRQKVLQLGVAMAAASLICCLAAILIVTPDERIAAREAMMELQE